MIYVWIAAGAALGGMLRYWCAGVASRLGADSLPWSTLFVNVTGSAVLGFVASVSGSDSRFVVSPQVRLFLTVGFCGGFTTFSTFSFETLRLLQDREYSYALLNMAGSMLMCLMGVWVGHAAGAAVAQR